VAKTDHKGKERGKCKWLRLTIKGKKEGSVNDLD